MIANQTYPSNQVASYMTQFFTTLTANTTIFCDHD